MTEPGPDFSRASRKKARNRSSKILNILIGIVTVLIIIVATVILTGGKDSEITDSKEKVTEQDIETDDNSSDELIDQSGDPESDSENSVGVEDNSEEKEETIDVKPGDVTYASSDDAVVQETVIKTGWEPIGTKQTGEHTSLYDGTSVDWNEKQDALAYATGMSKDNMIFWKIKNGGNPSKSIGIVSSKDKSERYRVYLEWVDGEGWEPVEMDVLNTLEFDY